MTRLTLTTTLVLTILAGHARAQPVEVFGGVTGVFLRDAGDFWGTGLRSVGVEARSDLPVSERFALEPFITFGRRSLPLNAYGATVRGGDTERVEAVYGMVVRQVLRSTQRPGFEAFVTYGVSGFYSRDSAPPRQFVDGRTVVEQPAWSHSRNASLPFPTVGVGVQKTLGARAAIRFDTQMTTFLWIPVGARASVGITVPFGGAWPDRTR
jgi:hypothetical protein